MEIKSKVFKRKTGKSKGKWIIRIEYFDEIIGKKRLWNATPKNEAMPLMNAK